jgi:hypothetical protein
VTSPEELDAIRIADDERESHQILALYLLRREGPEGSVTCRGSLSNDAVEETKKREILKHK